MPHQRKRAFTLIEILVVVTIIAMLSAILLVAVNSGRGAANTAKTVVKLKQINEWMNLWSGENDNKVLPSQFDYTLEAASGAPISVRRGEHAEDDNPYDDVVRGQYQGTWSDILWTDNGLHRTFGLLDKKEGEPYLIWESNSPDNDIYDVYESFDNPFRSTFDNTRGPAMGLPGYFAANDFFDARSAVDRDPFGEETSTVDRYYTYAQIHSPARSLYLVDSVAGETISQEPEPWLYDFGATAEGEIIDPNADTDGEVDYRYKGECMVLLLDGSSKTMVPWTERGPLVSDPGGSDLSLYGQGIRVNQLDKRKTLP
ncbi:MAG: type II secretion system protein [Phycisphaerales bacterium]|nr:type II secretion system protein [Phycisphaerales bacterium]